MYRDFVRPTLINFKPVVDEMVIQEQASIERTIKRIQDANAELGGSKEGFYFDGQLYSHRKPFELRGMKIHPLDASLTSRAKSLQNRITRVKKDSVALLQGLAVVSKRCESRQQLRDALPDVLVRKVPELMRFTRKDEEGWVFKNDPKQMKQFQTTVVGIALRFEADRLMHS